MLISIEPLSGQSVKKRAFNEKRHRRLRFQQVAEHQQHADLQANVQFLALYRALPKR
jgi:hypothetical protein